MFNKRIKEDIRKLRCDNGDLSNRIDKIQADLLKVKQDTCKHEFEFKMNRSGFFTNHYKICNKCEFKNNITFKEWVLDRMEKELNVAKETASKHGYKLTKINKGNSNVRTKKKS